MVTTAPKNSRNRRLHIVFFTDASKTKSTSISLRNLAVVVGLNAVFFSTAGLSIYLYRQNKSLIQAKDEYIRELKSAITSYAVTNEKNQSAMANAADPQTELARQVAREIQFPIASEKKITETQTDDTLSNLQSSLSSLSTVSANLARNEKDELKSSTFGGKGTGEIRTDSKNNVNDKSAGPNGFSAESATMPNIPPASFATVGRPSGLPGVQVEQSHTTEVNGQTTVHFQLVNTSPNRGQNWTGRVCGVAELTGTGGEQNKSKVSFSARGQVVGFLALPGGYRVDSAKPPGNGCADGELVRFSRLRPTELVVPVKQDAIKRVTIFFVESGSNRTLSQPIEL